MDKRLFFLWTSISLKFIDSFENTYLKLEIYNYIIRFFSEVIHFTSHPTEI